MTTNDNTELNAALRDLTKWDAREAGQWRRALASTGLRASRGNFGRLRGRRFSPMTVGISAAAVLILSAVVVNLVPQLSTAPARDRARKSPRLTADLKGVGQAMYVYQQGESGSWPYAGSSSALPRQFFSPSTTDVEMAGPTLDSQSAAGTPSVPASSLAETSRPITNRHVIRNANIELRTNDVRAVYLKARLSVQPELGEYVKESSLYGSGTDAFASMTLCVASARLPDAMNGLRELATVDTEGQTGRDVTEQVIDLEARLCNERRIEQELLKLLDERKDAPLSDVIQLREKLKEVRGEIERLVGQREGLAGLTDLATILVQIRSSDASASRGNWLSGSFGERISAGWYSGVDFMTGTLATMVQFLVGGSVIWVVVTSVVVVVWRRRRSR